MQQKTASYEDMLELTMHPTAAYAIKDLAAEALCLVPEVPLANIIASSKELQSQAPTGHWIEFKNEKMQLYISKPTVPNSTEIKEPEDMSKPWSINPHYWLGPAIGEKRKANMMSKAIDHQGYKFNVLVNFKAVAPGQKLIVFDPVRQAKKRKTA